MNVIIAGSSDQGTTGVDNSWNFSLSMGNNNQKEEEGPKHQFFHGISPKNTTTNKDWEKQLGNKEFGFGPYYTTKNDLFLQINLINNHRKYLKAYPASDEFFLFPEQQNDQLYMIVRKDRFEEVIPRQQKIEYKLFDETVKENGFNGDDDEIGKIMSSNKDIAEFEVKRINTQNQVELSDSVINRWKKNRYVEHVWEALGKKKQNNNKWIYRLMTFLFPKEQEQKPETTTTTTIMKRLRSFFNNSNVSTGPYTEAEDDRKENAIKIAILARSRRRADFIRVEQKALKAGVRVKKTTTMKEPHLEHEEEEIEFTWRGHTRSMVRCKKCFTFIRGAD